MLYKVLVPIALILLFGGLPAAVPPSVSSQTEFTLVGEWIVRSSPINGETTSRLGNTLGFPERDMFFSQTTDNLKEGIVLREDVGVNVEPLGVWRIMGNQFSATFQLWCDASPTCGTIVMRGEFTREDRIRGTMAAFFDQADPTRPTGFDTWRFSFVGNRVGGSEQ
jgi:hypothetical protein